MSRNTPTLAALSARMDTFEQKFDLLLERLGAPVEPTPKAGKKGKKAKATTPKVSPKVSNTPKAPQRTIEGKRCLTSGNREQFIAAHDWAERGMSTRQLAEAVLLDGQPLTGNWAIGPKRTAMVLGDTPVVPATVVVAENTRKAPAKRKAMTAKQREVAESPRRANGTIPPRKEWALREMLAETGKYDRHEIDAKVEEAYADPSLAEVFSLA